jgi:hypothetical protein
MRAGKRLRAWTIVALGLIASGEVATQASPIQFNTTGSVDSFGVTGTPVVTFQGVANGSMTAGSTFSLGQFQIAAPPAGTTSTYLNIPFQILFKVESIGGEAPSPNQTPVVLTGFLEGSVSSKDGLTNSASNLKVFFNSPVYTPENYPPYPTTILPFQTGGYNNYLNVTGSGDNGQPIQAVMISAPVPEPGSLAVFAGLVGLSAWRVRRRRAR